MVEVGGVRKLPCNFSQFVVLTDARNFWGALMLNHPIFFNDSLSYFNSSIVYMVGNLSFKIGDLQFIHFPSSPDEFSVVITEI